MSRVPREDERIARLLDGTEPVRDVSSARLVAVADRLRDAGRDAGLDPDPDFRAALRERLLAQAPGALPRPRPPDGPDSPHAVLARSYRRATSGPAPVRPVRPAAPAGPPRPSRAARSDRKLRNRRNVLVSVAIIGAALSASTMVASHDSLPGQPLYKVKRTVENVEAALERDPASRGRLHLAQARSRAEEIGKVAAVKGHPDELVGTLDSMDRLTRTGFRELATAAVTKSDDKALADLSTWVTDQQAIIDGTSTALPGSARLRVTQSLSLLQAASTRAVALASTPGCGCPTPPADELGPLPGTCPVCPPAAGGIAAATPAATVTTSVGPAGSPGPSRPAAPSSPTPSRPARTPSGSGGDPVWPLPQSRGPVVVTPSPTAPGDEAPSQPDPGGAEPSTTTPEEPAPTVPPDIDVPGLLEAVTDLIPPLLGG